MFIYELNGSGFESSCSHLTLRFRACVEQGVSWHSGNYRVWIQFETRTWHDKNIQSDVTIVFNKIEDFQNILKLSCKPLDFTSYKAFSKNKNRFRSSLPASFSVRFLKKCFSCYILLTDQISLCGYLYFVIS